MRMMSAMWWRLFLDVCAAPTSMFTPIASATAGTATSCLRRWSQPVESTAVKWDRGGFRVGHDMGAMWVAVLSELLLALIISNWPKEAP